MSLRGSATALARAVACLWLAWAVAVPATAAAGVALSALSVSGNQIVRDGVPFNFYGVNRDTLEWGSGNWSGCGGDGHFTSADWDAIAAWGGDAVRIPLSEADWLGRRCSASAYASSVDAAVAAANARGIYAILDLHWSDVGGLAPCDSSCLSGQQPMPDGDSLTFWRQVAARYANQPGVIFDLYNEPHDVSWGCWRDGGCTVSASTATVRYAAVGMQQLLDAVRSAGASNLVLVAGLSWAYDLSGVVGGYALTGSNIAYDTHVYTQWHNTVADWDAHVGAVAAAYPVTATEFGSIDCATADTLPLLQYFYAPDGNGADRISWTIWSWNDPGSCSQPSLLADWSGDALSGQGALIKSALGYLAGSNLSPTTLFGPGPTSTTPAPSPSPPAPVATTPSPAPVTTTPAPVATTRTNPVATTRSKSRRTVRRRQHRRRKRRRFR